MDLIDIIMFLCNIVVISCKCSVPYIVLQKALKVAKAAFPTKVCEGYYMREAEIRQYAGKIHHVLSTTSFAFHASLVHMLWCQYGRIWQGKFYKNCTIFSNT